MYVDEGAVKNLLFSLKSQRRQFIAVKLVTQILDVCLTGWREYQCESTPKIAPNFCYGIFINEFVKKNLIT
jgi:hypothetical protein